MAQRIWLIRHGKSSRPFGVVDHERPLSVRANADAALIRKWLDDGPQLFVASTARRALETAQLIAGKRPVTTHEDLYQATPAEFLQVIEETMEDAERVAFVAHNPTLTELVNHIADRSVTDNVPTLGAAVFEQKKRAQGTWRLAGYVAPKALR